MDEFAAAAETIIATGARLDRRGWAPATGGNYSIRLSDGTLAMTVSGVHKGRLTRDDIMCVSPDGVSLDGKKCSAETLLHCLIYAVDPTAGAALHTHSIANTLIGMVQPTADHIRIAGYELLKIFPGIDTHDTAVAVPLIDNDQDMVAMAAHLRPILSAQAPMLPTFCIRGHGLYGWGRTMAEAEHVVEATEFLLACELEAMKVEGNGR